MKIKVYWSIMKRFLKVIGNINYDDIRKRAQEILSSITGLCVQGPDPEIVPPLKNILRDMGVDRESKILRAVDAFPTLNNQ